LLTQHEKPALFEPFAFFLNSDNKPIQRVIQNKFTPGKGDRMGVCEPAI
jgi:hypothetical protein